jgi:hypothetical protein
VVGVDLVLHVPEAATRFSGLVQKGCVTMRDAEATRALKRLLLQDGAGGCARALAKATEND